MGIPNINEETAVKSDVKFDVQEESQVIVHCHYQGPDELTMIRVWKTIILAPHNSEVKCALLHSEGIVMYPGWMGVEPNQRISFSLIFSGLPRNCVTFDLLEIIPEAGGFEVRNIPRNKTDIYQVDFS